jgi:hypothetical protein
MALSSHASTLSAERIEQQLKISNIQGILTTNKQWEASAYSKPIVDHLIGTLKQMSPALKARALLQQ